MLIDDLSETDKRVVIDAARKNMADVSDMLEGEKIREAVAARREAAWVFRHRHGYNNGTIGAILGLERGGVQRAIKAHEASLCE